MVVPRKTEAGASAHTTFVMLMMATATAYRLWDKTQAEAESVEPVAYGLSSRMMPRHGFRNGRRIPYGDTVTYGNLAVRLDRRGQRGPSARTPSR
jgi:O6-methylguanine-DNA--protein-cysteine methyltransferase